MTAATDASAGLAMPLDAQQRAVLRALLGMQRQSWEQGVASHALLDLGLVEDALLLAHDAVVRQTPAGKLGEVDDVGIVNSGACGEAVALAARAEPAGPFGAALDRQLAWLLREAPCADDGTLFHIEGTREMWVDSVYMVVPLLHLVGQPEAARLQFEGHRDRLFDASAGLWGWRWSEDEHRVTHPEHWGTGNGWVVAGIARAMRSGGAGDPWFAAEGPGHARVVIDAALAAAAHAGGFHDVLDDPSTFAEGNVRQMLAYGILAGVADGWLPASYRGVGERLVAEARDAVDDRGLVRGVCGAPRFDRQGTSPEAQAMFLLATAASTRSF
ncbi:glycoside hydrolase family 88 protein [uncultured Amnibacterium sp.]|uniref:glycoside hydrolase family 88 protein n=1 Tax=uncultured Amnibacterium sp. TaxID=1631851 RepID=UPI0035CA524B